MTQTVPARQKVFGLVVIVAALGYFVDIYDLLLFSVVKKQSMLAVGSTDASLLVDSTRVINWQMIGLLLGGIIWGMLGDKRGRLSVLFGSIILYSIANFCNGFIQTVDQYVLCRFIAGLGLAGELGAGITLVTEQLPKEKRGIGTSLVAGIGLIGAVMAFVVYKLTGNWRTCYQIGGILGICLLALRISVVESGMFLEVRDKKVPRGNFAMFFTSRDRFRKYITAILIGLPNWFVIGVLINQSDRFALKLFGNSKLDSGKSIMLAYIGISIGDVLVGLLSQYFKSRKKALLVYYVICALGLIAYFSGLNRTDTTMYWICALAGFSVGFWAIFVTMGAEQFGTNLRATAATTIPNMARGSLVLINLLFLDLFQKAWKWSLIESGIVTGVIVMVIALIAFYFTDETFHKDLNYTEA